jgi:hypothetical protein
MFPKFKPTFLFNIYELKCISLILAFAISKTVKLSL